MQGASVEALDAQRSALLNGLILWLSVVATPGIMISLARAHLMGWRPLMSVHLMVLIALWGLWIGRRNLSYRARILGLLIIVEVTIYAGLVQLGPMALSGIFVMSVSFIAVLFLGSRLAWWIIIGNIPGLILVGIAASRQWLTFDLDYPSYAHHPLIWIHTIWTFVSYSLITAWIGWRLIRLLVDRERVIREERNLHQYYLDTTQTIMVSLDQNGRITMINRKGREFLGGKDRGLLGCQWFELAFSQPFGMETLYPLFIAAMGGAEAAPRSFESSLVDRDCAGGERWIAWENAYLKDAEGQVTGMLSTGMDITQRKHIEEKLRNSEERHRLIADNSLDLIWTMTLDGQLTYVSPAVEKLLGYTPEEFIRRPVEDRFTPDSLAVVREGLVKARTNVAAGLPVRFLEQLQELHKDGSILWTDVRATSLCDHEGRFVEILGISRDITEQKRGEQELQQARDAAQAATLAKSQFLAHMSHEIRTPMNGVLGMAQLLEQEPLTDEQQAMLENIRSAGRSLLSIINDILDLSKIEAGEFHLDPQPFVLAKKLANVSKVMAVTAQAKGIGLRMESDPALAGHLRGDALRLEQVLFNLAGNAVKFTEHGEVIIRVLPAELTPAKVRLRFEVRDTGIGMSPEVVAQLFSPFKQADHTISRRFGGTGLGLSISKRLVELMGGAIGVDSTPGVGSVFWFELPFERIAEEAGGGGTGNLQITGDAQPTRNTGFHLTGLRVLVVDDNAINRMVVERALTREGAILTLASDGQAALKILEAQPDGFDVVLMDVQMPVMDGLTATQAIRHHLEWADLPIFALTAGVLPEEREAALAAGMGDVITKPIDLQRTKEILSRYVKPG